MPLPSTMTPIATQTLSATSATVTFSNIPQNYTDLFIVTSVLSNNDESVNIRFNSDSGTNYSQTEMNGNGSTVSSSRGTNSSSFQSGRLSPDPTTNIVNVMNYSNTTTFKTTILKTSSQQTGYANVQAIVSLYRSTSAINTITFFRGGGGNLFSGSTFTIYGIKAAS